MTAGVTGALLERRSALPMSTWLLAGCSTPH
jgi:hypothetical protein